MKRAAVPLRLFADELVAACAACGIDDLAVVVCADGNVRCEICASLDGFDWRTGKPKEA